MNTPFWLILPVDRRQFKGLVKTKIAGDARKKLEKESGRKVIKSQNYLLKKLGR
ncbi:MAG: hypothetical protein UW74_C0044G0007 [Candidatus Giovannonibacteria bacterium GW2011_GWC2_44_8]|uniref:Uncharacterized protein n=1 Tax=Candidatus Giovannonibacteria bacterium GW2011_GWC2_44_8 TaxID=1618657 RepID=A0A0G1K0D0_9BACT|nr:MAG: hypothetical protein UW74_C0044G0007 [Candidatus Giovannonibacteria bacterium GW2011_GWC2_44_8]